MLEKLDSGKAFSLHALIVDGQCFVRDFIDGLPKEDKVQIFALFKLILDNGPPKNERKFRSLGEKIFELKTRRGVRILCFFGESNFPNSLILTHGFRKPKRNQLRNEKKRALKLYYEYCRLGQKIH